MNYACFDAESIRLRCALIGFRLSAATAELIAALVAEAAA